MCDETPAPNVDPRFLTSSVLVSLAWGEALGTRHTCIQRRTRDFESTRDAGFVPG